jgi:hypothetical protein
LILGELHVSMYPSQIAANNIVSDTEFILMVCVCIYIYIYIMNIRGSEIDPWGTPCFSVPQSDRKLLVVFGDFTSTFLVKCGG